MRPLIIDEKAKADIAAVCEYADLNRMEFRELQARCAVPDGYSPVGDDENLCCNIFQGFRCVFSIEEQQFGWTRHLSISVDSTDKMPHVEAVRMLAVEFGIDKPLEECQVYIEDTTPKSVNIICPI